MILIEADFVTAGRTCEQCGIVMPYGHPRLRADDGRMLCNGCHPDGAGPGEGRPVGHHGARTADLNDGLPGMGFVRWVQETYHRINHGESGDAIPSWFPKSLLLPEEIASTRFAATAGMGDTYSTCKNCGKKIVDSGSWNHGASTLWEHDDSDSECDDPEPTEKRWTARKVAALDWLLAPGSGSYADRQKALFAISGPYRLTVHEIAARPGQWVWGANPTDFNQPLINAGANDGPFDSSEEAQAAAEAWAAQRTGSRKVAHDSGDGERIFHCPFCGAGKVTGRSDGTVECGFCNTHFTVQVQPQHPGVPQTINGEPYKWPGQPEGTFDPTDQTAMDPTQEAPPGGPPKDLGDQAPADDEPNGKVPPQFASLRYLITEAGVALPEESYLRHLAIRYADDPQRVIAEVRSTR